MYFLADGDQKTIKAMIAIASSAGYGIGWNEKSLNYPFASSEMMPAEEVMTANKRYFAAGSRHPAAHNAFFLGTF
jgi:hypothetical protein